MEPDSQCQVDSIKHSGIIKQLDDQYYYVSIVAQSACSACHSKSVCNMGSIREEIIEVPKTGNSEWKPGDQVEIVMHKTLGTQAVLLGYVYPFLLLLVTLITGIAITSNEGLSALLAIVILIPYYLLLYSFRNRLKKTFSFKIV